MKIAAALCWFHEPPEFLDRLVRSIDFADEIVALDGPWEHFSHRDLASPAEQQDALYRACSACDIPLVGLGGDRLWASQVAKRAFLYETVSERADWMFVVDGDEEITHQSGLRDVLEEAELDVGSVHVTRVSPGRRGLERMARRLFRTRYGLSVMETHNGIVTDDGRWLAGPRRIAKEPRIDLGENVRILHRQMQRGGQRDMWSQRYYSTRARLRIEVH